MVIVYKDINIKMTMYNMMFYLYNILYNNLQLSQYYRYVGMIHKLLQKIRKIFSA